MKTRKVIVPRRFVRQHYPHPEEYGESFVELSNGMVTDVYTDDDGFLYTLTNDHQLINFLKNQIITDDTLRLWNGSISLRTMLHQDRFMLLDWFRRSNILEEKYSIEQLVEFISHSIHISAHQFIIEWHKKGIGYCGYSIAKDVASVHFVLLDDYQQYVNGQAAFQLMVNHIKDTSNAKLLSTIVLVKDHTMLEFYFTNHFNIIETYVIPISNIAYKNAYILTKSI